MSELARRTLEALRDRVGLSEERIVHSLGVALLSLDLADQMEEQGAHVDREVVELGALLHDSGLARCRGPLQEIPGWGIRLEVDHARHHIDGYEICLELDYPKTVARCALVHAYGPSFDESVQMGFQPPVGEEIFPCSAEEKAVAMGDLAMFCRIMGWDPWADETIGEQLIPLVKVWYAAITPGAITTDHPYIRRLCGGFGELRRFGRRELLTVALDTDSYLV